MLNVSVPKVVLDKPCVGALVSQCETAAMPQHVGVGLDVEASQLTIPFDQVVHLLS